MIVDVNVLLAAFFPDEQQAQAQDLIRAHVSGQVHLLAPTLLLYEFTNALGRYRRLNKDFEHQPRSSEAMVHVASIHRMLRLLAALTPISKRPLTGK